MTSECRICGERIFTPHPKNIFEKRNHRIRMAIEQITGLEIVLEKMLPQHICSCCLLDLTQAVAFRQRCLETHANLHQRSSPKSSVASKGSAEALQVRSDPILKREVQEDTVDTEDDKELMEDDREFLDEDKEFMDDDKDFLEDVKPIPSFSPAKKIRLEAQKLPNSQSPRVRVKRLRVQEVEKSDSPPQSPRERVRKPRKRRPKPKVDRSIKRYVCDQCGWSFNDHSNMKDHKLRHFEEKFSCDECGRKFYTMPLLRLHIRVHHKGEKPYVCKFCGMGFANSPSRCRHERQMHANELVHPCKICGKRFNSEKGRLKHEEGHKSDQPDVHICLTCNKEFKEAQFLHRHYSTKYHRKRVNLLVDDPKEEFQSDADPEESPGYMEEGQAEMEDSQAELDVILEDVEEEQYEDHEELLDQDAPFEDYEYDEVIAEDGLYT
ncbi:zinc finger protein 354B [Drosophila santomea]|uniref:zinc finger protein 354B n=1 Tax=Drosophila santomea TaxID=129105 RepID=UPI001CCA18E8|nr:zinc finger protein 354B [Drosophila santomea]